MPLHVLVTTVLLGQGTLLSGSGPSPEDFVVTEKTAYLVLPPQAVAGPQAIFMDWSPSGRYLFTVQAQPALTGPLVNALFQGVRPAEPSSAFRMWDRIQSRSTDLGSIKGYSPVGTAFTGPRWFGALDVAVDLATETIPALLPGGEPTERVSLLRFDLPSGKLHVVPLADPLLPGNSYQLFVSPNVARALLVETRFQPRDPQRGHPSASFSTFVSTIDAHGRRGTRSELIAGSVTEVIWPNDRQKAAIRITRIAEGSGTSEWLEFDLGSAKTTKVAQPPARSVHEPPASPLEIAIVPAQTTSGTATRTHRAAWLRSLTPSDQTEFLLAMRASHAILNSTCDAVAVMDEGVVTVRPLVGLPIEVYRVAKEAAEKTRALSNAKQVATALHMFAADNQDRLPSPEEFGKVNDYLKNSSVSKDFVYTFKGGPLSGVDRPTETMVGYIPVAGGYAIAYADGHIKWNKDLPKG